MSTEIVDKFLRIVDLIRIVEMHSSFVEIPGNFIEIPVGIIEKPSGIVDFFLLNS